MRSKYKLWQLHAARRAGLRVPDTLITTEPEEAARFAAVGPLIVKAVSGRHPENPPVTLPTSRVPAGADFSGVAASATCLQGEVAKVADLRLTVIGDHMFPCLIRPKKAGAPDWRFLEPDECDWEMVTLHPGIRRAVRRYMTAAGLVYAAFDFALDAQGRYWFLEANSSGQFGFVEMAAGAPIAAAIADWLALPFRVHRHV